MTFDFLKEELTEARYIRTPNQAIGRSGDNIAEGFFEHLLVLQQMRFENPTWARQYAKDTLKFMNFSNVRTGATDLHNLAAIVSNPSKFSGKVDGLPGRFDELAFKRYLRNIVSNNYNPAQDRIFLTQMQKNLEIKGGLLARARRVIADYGKATPGERSGVSARMVNTFRQDGRFKSDLFKPYAAAVKSHLPAEPKGSILKKAGKIAAWGAAGYALGRYGPLGK